MDVKKIGRIPDGGGWKTHDRGHRDRRHGAGFDFVHSLVDDHSRLAYSEILPDEKGTTCAVSCSAPRKRSPKPASPRSNASSPTTT